MKISTEVYTSKINDCERFYVEYFQFKVKFKTEGFVILQHKKYPEYELMFCLPNSPFINPVFHPEYNGKGVIFQFEVDNVEQEYKRLKKLGLDIIVDLVKEDINGHHFTIKDPSGLLIDIVSY